MTKDKENKICVRCNFKELRYNKKKQQAEHFCKEANEFISALPYCPLYASK